MTKATPTTTRISMRPNQLRAVFGNAAQFSSTETARPVLYGALLDVHDNRLRVQATDSYMAMISTVALDDVDDVVHDLRALRAAKTGVHLPYDFLRDAMRLAHRRRARVEIEIDHKAQRVACRDANGYEIGARLTLLEPSFPDIVRVREQHLRKVDHNAPGDRYVHLAGPLLARFGALRVATARDRLTPTYLRFWFGATRLDPVHFSMQGGDDGDAMRALERYTLDGMLMPVRHDQGNG